MRIVYITPESPDGTPGVASRDAALMRGLRGLGHEVMAAGLYMPIHLNDGENEPQTAARVGALHRAFPKLAGIPGHLFKFLKQHSSVMNAVSFAVGGRGTKVGTTAVSLLALREQRQRTELARLLRQIDDMPKPDIIVLSNTLMSGLAKPLAERIGKPIVCMASDGDIFVENLDEPFRSDARKLIRENARSLRMVVVTSDIFARRIMEFLSLPAARMHKVRPGIDVDYYASVQSRPSENFTIGYLANISPEKGLDVVVDAMELMVRELGMDPRLWIAGRVCDPLYWRRIERRLGGQLLRGRTRVFGELTRDAKREFFSGLNVFAMPSRLPEVRGTTLLEAMAAGIPVVGPAAGIVPEILDLVHGGLLVPPEVSGWLFAQAFSILATAPETAVQLGRVAREGVREKYSIEKSVDGFEDLFESLANNQRPSWRFWHMSTPSQASDDDDD